MISTCGVVKNRCNCITTLNKVTLHHQKSMGLITIQCVVNGQDQGESYDSHDGAGKFGEPKGGWKFQICQFLCSKNKSKKGHFDKMGKTFWGIASQFPS